jgi:predicted ATPase/DNA-binding CsgD family transcriptional regulator
MSHLTDEDRLVPLTQREIEVIELVAGGLSNQEIADSMVITVHTVKAHLKHIFAKLEAGKRTQAVARARELGLLHDARTNAAQATTPSHNLPRSLIPLIGRDNELSVLADYLTDTNHRLITVHGPGGIGKTHLALEAAWQHLAAFRDGVFMISLEPLESSLFLLPAIAEALGFRFSGQEERKEQLLAYLSDKQMLLVLDGFEHLLGNTVLISDLIGAASELTVMVTSRERLNLHGEALFSVQGLPYPGGLTEKTSESEAVALFCYCVERVLPGFQPDTTDLAHIVDICQFVEGLPLAILLAASWANALSIQDILTEIQQQAHVLETDALNTLFQYKGLGHVFQRSWNLLEPHQRDAFMRLTVFSGSFSRDTAQQVTGVSPRALSALVNKAMIEWDPLHKLCRIHRLFRQYGLIQLQAAGLEETIRETHLNFFTEFAQSGCDDLKQNPTVQQDWDHAIADLRAALRWALGTEQTDRMIELCLAMDPYWAWRGYFQEYFAWLTQALAATTNPSSDLHAHALRIAGELAWKLGEPVASRDYTWQSIQIWDQLENPDEICRALMVLGDNEHRSGNFSEAVKTYERVLEIARKPENKTFLAMGLHGLGLAAGSQQHYQQAMEYYRQSLDYSRQVGNQRFIGVILCNMGVIAFDQGDLDEATRLYSEALEIVRRENDLVGVVINLANLSEIAFNQHDCSRARQLSLESLQFAHQIGFKMAVAHQLELIAQIEHADGDPAKGARLYGAAEALREAIDFPVPPRETEKYTTVIDAIRAKLTPARFETAWAAGRTADIDAMIDELALS